MDARLLEKDGIATAELSNGSIFCACIKDNFIKALIEMSKRDIENLFIEASGLADPSNMDQILEAHPKRNRKTPAATPVPSACWTARLTRSKVSCSQLSKIS